jgi:hypothetical protein
MPERVYSQRLRRVEKAVVQDRYVLAEKIGEQQQLLFIQRFLFLGNIMIYACDPVLNITNIIKTGFAQLSKVPLATRKISTVG